MVFQWNADGSEYAEMNFGGNGKTDAWGAPGTGQSAAFEQNGQVDWDTGSARRNRSPPAAAAP